MRRILILKHGALGDVIRTSYIAESLKSKYPGCRIEWVTRDHAVDLVRFHHFIDRVWGVDRTGHFKAGEGLESDHYDWVLSLDDEIESCALATQVCAEKITGAYLAGDKVVPSADALPWFGMGLISPSGKAEADRAKLKNQLTHAEIFRRILGLDFIRGSFYNDPQIEKTVHARFSDGSFHIGLNLSAGKRWKSKSLRIEEAVSLVKLIAGAETVKKIRIHLLGGVEDLPYNREILSRAGEAQLDLLPPASLLEFAAIIASQRLIITSDSMALHMAIAQKIRNVSFYAPTSAAEIETFGLGRKILSTAPDYCSYRPDADNCSITADRIWKEAAELISLE